MRKLKRRLQQLFIACAVVGAGSVVACGSDEDFKDIFLFNDTQSSTTVVIDAVRHFDEEDDFIFRSTYDTVEIAPGEWRWTFVLGYEESNHWIFLDKDSYAATRILWGDEDFRFWVKLKAIGNAGCSIHVTDQLLNHLRENRDQTEFLTKDRFRIDDPELLNPGGVTGESFDECFGDNWPGRR